MSISYTGIRDGETIIGSPGHKQTKGTVMKIKGFYPPYFEFVKNIDPLILRDEFNNISFFSGMTPVQRLEWLIENSTPKKDVYLEDLDLRVKFTKITSDNFFIKQLGQDKVNELLSGNPDDLEGYWHIKDVYNMFPGKPGSRAKRKTLIFRPGNWMLLINKRLVDSYNGVYIDLDKSTVNNGYVVKPENGKIYSFELENKYLQQLGVVINEIRKTSLTEELLFGICGKYVSIQSMYEVKEIIKWFTPSLHKSLIQKSIRTRCKNVEYAGKLYDASVVLLTSFSLLLLHSGVFVPNIRRFVTGLESAAKRMAVAICEDSYTTNHKTILSLYASSLLAQDDRNWLPTDAMLDQWIQLAIQTQKDGNIFDYNIKNFTGIITVLNELSMSYILLNEVRSFKSDIDLVGSIAQNEGIPREVNPDSIMEVMPLIHCVDHHSYTDVLHFMPYTGEPYAIMFKKLWEYVTGVNTRMLKYANYFKTMESQEFVKQARTAQRDLWISKSYTPTNREVILNTTSDFNYSLDPTWLAGLIGPIEVKVGRSSAIVVLQISDIYEMIAVKKPQRGANTIPELTEEESDAAIDSVKQLLSHGYKLSNVPSTLPLFKNATVKLQDDIYYITLSIQGNPIYKWEEVLNLLYKFPIHKHLDGTIINALLYTGDGMDEKSGEVIDYIMNNYNLISLRRLLTYLTGYKSSIELHKISRDGSGVYYQVIPEDTAVNHILCYLCVMYPVCIVKTSSGFNVKNGPLLWTIRDMISSKLSVRLIEESQWTLPSIETRQRWEHQITALNQMIDRNKQGKKGHLIWIPVGMGKTLIVIDYLDYMIKAKKMPMYCVYSLPSSAINNIVNEFNMRNIPVKVIDARMTAPHGSNFIEPYKICIIKHDHMRLNEMDVQLKKISQNMIFIIDEFHKTLSKTIRTSIALELTKLSYDFVGLSGTIIKDTHHDELIQWLEQIVEFEVNTKNYWVAIGAMISRKVFTKIVVDRQIIAIKIPDNRKVEYNSMVPEKLGGTARHIDFKGAVNLCYDVVTDYMVDLVVQYINANEGLFIIAKDITHQQKIRSILMSKGIQDSQIFLFGKDSQITLTPEYNGPIKIVITTIRHSAGYTLTKFRIMITSVYFTNQATREQLEGRINRIGQISPMVRIITIHTGILSYVHERYEKVRNMAEALKGFAKDVGVTMASIRQI